MNLLRYVLAALLLASLPFRVADAQPITVFDKADFIWTYDPRPPHDAANWAPVALPHRWHDTHPGISGPGWYRIKFDVAWVPLSAQAVKVTHWRSRFVDFYVNGSLIGGSRDVTSGVGGGLGAGVFLTIPPSLLRTGENVIHASMQTFPHPINFQGLGRVTFGDARAVRRAYSADSEWGYAAERTFLGIALAAGLITFFVWLARRKDRVMLWFSVVCLSWAIVGIAFYALRMSDQRVLLAMLRLYMENGLVVPAAVLALGTVDLKWPRLEAAIWAYLAIEVAAPLWTPLLPPRSVQMVWKFGFDSINAVILVGGVGVICYAAKRPLRWPIRIELAALLAMAGLMLYEAARILGWIYVESPFLRLFHVPIMMLAVGAAIYERHVATVWRMERSNFELEQRVAEKAVEIEAAHANLEEANRARTLAQERQRILGDMHDGVGASLVGLLRYVQSGSTDNRDLERRVRAALQEMRIAVDALEPAEGDLAAVLGKLRYRLEPLIESAGARFVWEVAALPQVEALEAAAVFSIQRILLEAIANVLHHSAARQIRVTVRDEAGRGIRIRIEDDGKGFDTSVAAAGVGLRNMRARAERLGAELDIRSNPGRGTTISLLVPHDLRRAMAPRPQSTAAIAEAAPPILSPAPG